MEGVVVQLFGFGIVFKNPVIEIIEFEPRQFGDVPFYFLDKSRIRGTIRAFDDFRFLDAVEIQAPIRDHLIAFENIEDIRLEDFPFDIDIFDGTPKRTLLTLEIDVIDAKPFVLFDRFGDCLPNAVFHRCLCMIGSLSLFSASAWPAALS